MKPATRYIERMTVEPKGKDPVLSRTEVVLDRDSRWSSPETIVFASEYSVAEEEGPQYVFAMDETTYRDMGSPAQVTVLVRPGDWLNMEGV